MEIHNNKLYLALVLSGLVHGLLLFQYQVDSTVSTDAVSESIDVQIELSSTSHKAAPVKRIAKSEIIEREDVAEQVSQSIVETEAADFTETQDVVVQQDLAASENHEQFLSLLHQAIDQNKRYPYLARRQHREGTVQLQFVMRPDGMVSDITVVSSSQFAMLDDAARQAVESISPFSLATNYLNKIETYNVNINFRLN